MKVILNNTAVELPDQCTLAQALALHNIPATGIAVAVNDRVIRKADHATHTLHQGDEIIIIKAFYGG